MKRIKKLKIKKKIKNLLGELSWQIITGVIIAILTVAITPIVTDIVEERSQSKKESETLSNMRLGESEEYVKSQLGEPIVTFSDVNGYIVSYYKLKNNVVCCSYDDNSIVFFVVIKCTDKKIYQYCNANGGTFGYLGDVTYFDYTNRKGIASVSLPANNTDYLYYTELFYGAAPYTYSYILIGNYKYFSDADTELLLSEYDSNYKEVDRLRKIAKPNIFGIIKVGYEDKIEFPPEPEDGYLQTYIRAVFGF